MEQNSDKTASANRAPYERPKISRVAVRTSREHLQWQHGDSGSGICSNHNHDSGTAGCDFPQ